MPARVSPTPRSAPPTPGYLTRRLVDVAQELIVRDDDCGSVRGIWVENITPDPEHARALEAGLLSRCLAEDLTLADGTVVPRNTEVTDEVLEVLVDDTAVTRARVRSVLTCEYPRHLADEVDAEPAEGDDPEADEKYRAGVCSALLRHDARHRQARRPGRGHRHHRGPVDR